MDAEETQEESVGLCWRGRKAVPEEPSGVVQAEQEPTGECGGRAGTRNADAVLEVGGQPLEGTAFWRECVTNQVCWDLTPSGFWFCGPGMEV